MEKSLLLDVDGRFYQLSNMQDLFYEMTRRREFRTNINFPEHPGVGAKGDMWFSLELSPTIDLVKLWGWLMENIRIHIRVIVIESLIYEI